MQIIKPSFYLFTDGPGAGKTATLERLSTNGEVVVPEVAREIIRHQKGNGGDATHDGNRPSAPELAP